MWRPGTLLFTTHSTIVRQCQQPAEDQLWRPRFVLVIGVNKTGYGTKGDKWDALLLAEGKLFTFHEAWRHADGIRTLTDESESYD